MVNGTSLHTPLLFWMSAISRIVRQPREMLRYCAHTHSHVRHTIEQWTDEQMNYNTNIAHKRANRLYYIKYDGLLLHCPKQWHV